MSSTSLQLVYVVIWLWISFSHKLLDNICVKSGHIRWLSAIWYCHNIIGTVYYISYICNSFIIFNAYTSHQVNWTCESHVAQMTPIYLNGILTKQVLSVALVSKMQNTNYKILLLLDIFTSPNSWILWQRSTNIRDTWMQRPEIWNCSSYYRSWHRF